MRWGVRWGIPMVVLTVLLTEQLLLGISKEGVLTESLTSVSDSVSTPSLDIPSSSCSVSSTVSTTIGIPQRTPQRIPLLFPHVHSPCSQGTIYHAPLRSAPRRTAVNTPEQ